MFNVFGARTFLSAAKFRSQPRMRGLRTCPAVAADRNVRAPKMQPKLALQTLMLSSILDRNGAPFVEKLEHVAFVRLVP